MPKHDLTQYRLLEIEAPFAVSAMDPYKIPESGEEFYMDITKQLGSTPVVVEEDDEAIGKLSFTISHGAAVYIDTLRVGLRVKFTAGYQVEVSGKETKRVFFHGYVSELNPQFPNEGRMQLEVVAEDPLYLLTRNKPGHITYPAIKKNIGDHLYRRDFHYKSSIKLSEIVWGIILEYNIPIKDIKIDSVDDRIFTLTDPITQAENESDFTFLQRLLTGKSEQSMLEYSSKKERKTKLVNGHARMFIETNPKTGGVQLHVIPESILATTKGKIEFLYQTSDALVLGEHAYDPTSSTATLIIRDVSLTENADDGLAQEVQRSKDVKKKGKGKKDFDTAEAEADPERGVTVTEEIEEPVDMFKWKLNDAKVKADRDAGIISSEDIPRLLSDKHKWSDVKHYFVKRKQVYEQGPRGLGQTEEQLANDPKKEPGPEKAEPEKVIGKGSGGRGSKASKKSKKIKQRPRVRKFGHTLNFSTHGNIFVLCRMNYFVQFPVGKYSAKWYLYTLKHTFGNTYRMEAELGR